MERAIGIISANYKSEQMDGLTITRSTASVPFGARFRMIDFSLSNMVNSGLISIGVIIPAKSRSLLDHIGFGKNWTLDRKVGGLYLLPEQTDHNDASFLDFILRDVAVNKEFLLRSKQTYAVISGSHIVCNINYQPMLNLAREQQADVILVGSSSSMKKKITTKLISNASSEVIEIEENKEKGIAFLDTLIIRRELLLDMINSNSDQNILHLIKDKLDKWKVLSYDHRGYIGVISNVNEYFTCNQDLLSEEVQKELFRSSHPIITKVHDKNPTRLYENSDVVNSVLHSGCEIDGKVKNSIIFRDVKIGTGAVVKNSIIMPGVTIGDYARIEYAIIDKSANVCSGDILQGDTENIYVMES